jgi:hypothetical protein
LQCDDCVDVQSLTTNEQKGYLYLDGIRYHRSGSERPLNVLCLWWHLHRLLQLQEPRLLPAFRSEMVRFHCGLADSDNIKDILAVFHQRTSSLATLGQKSILDASQVVLAPTLFWYACLSTLERESRGWSCLQVNYIIMLT